MTKPIKPPVTLCMIVRNEERRLGRCLASASPFVSEMVIVDTGSNDRTADVAAEYGARLYSMEWQDDFAAARNRSLELAAEPWVLVLDADEALAETRLDVWEELLSSPDCYGYYVQLCSWLKDEAAGKPSGGTGSDGTFGELAEGQGKDGEGGYIADAVCRLFRNDSRIRFAGAIHEEVATAVAAFGEAALRYAPIVIWHEGYRPSVMAERQKAERNARILRAALERQPDNAVLRYAAGTEAFTYGRWHEAIHWLEPLAAGENGREGYESDMLLKLSHAHRLAGLPEQAERWAALGLDARGYGDFPDLYDALAAALLDQDRAAEAAIVLEKALRVGRAPFFYSSAPGSGSWRTQCAAGYAYERTYRWELAAGSYVAVLERHPACWQAWERLMLLGSVDGRFLQGLLSSLEALLQPDKEEELRHLAPDLLERLADMGLERLDAEEGKSDSGERLGVRKRGRAGEGQVDFCRAKGKGDTRQEVTKGLDEKPRLPERLIAAACAEPDASFWRGLLYAQRGDTEAARICWRSGHPRAALYLAALERRAAPLPPLPHSAAARVLPRVRAWQAFSLRPQGGAAEAAAMPPLLWCALLRCAPNSRAAARYGAHASGGAPAELAAGVLAAAAAEWRAAAERFGCALAEPAQPWVSRAAAAGLAAVMAARARSAAGVRLPELGAEAEMKLRAVSALFPL